MKILVTGGAGFIGSAVIRNAIKKGHSVINVDCLNYAACLKNLAEVEGHRNYFFEKVNIRNKKKVSLIFEKYKPDRVMHLAAESHVDRSIDGPEDFIKTNIIGTYNLLQASYEHWVSIKSKNFLFHHISTDEVFGSLPNKKSIKFKEDTPYDPRSPYSASKASSDHLVRAWNKTYGLPFVLTNCSNNYGPFHFPEKLIPLVIINALLGKNIPIYGDGSNIRDWLYVEDHASALLKVLSEGIVGSSYNIGGNNECTNLDLVNMICKILDKVQPKISGSYSDLIEFVEDRPGHDIRYSIDATKIKNELGWSPSVNLEEGLKKTIMWYIDNKSWWKPLLKRKSVGTRLGKKI